MDDTIRGWVNPSDDLENIHYTVDIPKLINGQPSDEWINVEYFSTKEEALHFAQSFFGADENGMICIISNF